MARLLCLCIITVFYGDIILVSYCFLMPCLCVFVFLSDECGKCSTWYAWTELGLLVLDVVLAIFVFIVVVKFKGNTC